jgi:hypothetical protein
MENIQTSNQFLVILTTGNNSILLCTFLNLHGIINLTNKEVEIQNDIR